MKSRVPGPPPGEVGASRPKPAPQKPSLDGGFEHVLDRAVRPPEEPNLAERAAARSALPMPQTGFAAEHVEAPAARVAPARPDPEARVRQIEGIVRAVRTMLTDRVQQLQMDLDASALGLRGTSIVRQPDGRLSLVLRTSDPSPSEALLQFRTELVEALRAQGLTVGDVHIAAWSGEPATPGPARAPILDRRFDDESSSGEGEDDEERPTPAVEAIEEGSE